MSRVRADESAKPKVLLIDDEPDLCEVLRTMLEREGYEFLWATRGREGVKLVHDVHPDVLILDNKLPDLDGMQVLERVRKLDPELPVIVSTGYGDVESAVTYIKKGAFHYLTKPFEKRDLLLTIEHGIEEREHKRETKRLVSQLSIANHRLQEANEMKSEFVGMVSHELKNPVSVIMGYMDLMLEDEDNPLRGEHKVYVKNTMRVAKQIANLIDDILDLTQIETGKIPLSPESIDLKALVEEVVEERQMAARDRGVRVSVVFPKPMREVVADSDLLRSLLANFVSNGIKYNKDGGALMIHVHGETEGYVMRFEDNGIGISEDDQRKLFGRFFRADQVRDSDIPGTGLGMSVVKAIVEQHGGTIAVESQLGEGTTFRVFMPWEPPKG